MPLHTHSTRSLVLCELHLQGAGELAELSGWEGCLGIWGCREAVRERPSEAHLERKRAMRREKAEEEQGWDKA